MVILGIDLGTTNSACAVWQDGKSVLIPNRLGEYLTPSVVGFDDHDEMLVGQVARHRLISHPNLTTSVFKRYMGSSHQLKLGNRTFTAAELSALVLRSLKEDAETFTGEEIEQAVISVPAYFNDVQRKATKLAGELAGLSVQRLINEPTAAAMMYGLQERDDGAQYMILDMGGGTFDVSIIEYFDGVLEVHASSGDNYLGGEDFSKALLDAYLEHIGVAQAQLKPGQKQHIYTEIDAVKKKLSYAREVVIEKGIHEKQATPWTLNRSMFEKIVKPLLHRVQSPIERTLRDARIDPQDINEIVLVGGATRMPVFRSLVSKMFRRLPAGNIDPDLVVAMGAGVQAGLKQRDKDLKDIVLTDVCPYTIGVELVNENDRAGEQGGLFMPIIERNSVVPISVEKLLCTVENNQSEVQVNIYQGESRLVKHNVYLGEIKAKVPKASAGEENLSIRYSYDMNGLLDIDITVLSTGETFHKTIMNAPGSLTEAEIEHSKKKLAKLKFHPREHEQNRTIIARAERLYECSLGEKREYISNMLVYFDQVLEQQNPQEIQRIAKKITQVLEELEQDNLFS